MAINSIIPHIAIMNGMKTVSLFNFFATRPTAEAAIAKILNNGPNFGNSLSPTHYVFSRLGLFPNI
jgi:hypothetical protein